MRGLFSAVVRPIICALLVVALTSVASFAQSPCSNQRRGPGEGRFVGEITSVPDGSTMQLSYGTQTVTVRYSGSVVCEGGQAAPVSALVRGANVSVFGALNGMEIDATRIFVAEPRAPGVNRAPEENGKQTQ